MIAEPEKHDVTVYKSSFPPPRTDRSGDSSLPDDRYYVIAEPTLESDGYIEVIGRYRIELKWLGKLERVVIDARGRSAEEVRARIAEFLESVEEKVSIQP